MHMCVIYISFVPYVSLLILVSFQVIGAYFEKVGSKSFAVYSIAVTDNENNTWFVKRRSCSGYFFFNY